MKTGTWNRFCDAMDAHRAALKKIEAKNRKLRAEAEREIQRLLKQRRTA